MPGEILQPGSYLTVAESYWDPSRSIKLLDGFFSPPQLPRGLTLALTHALSHNCQVKTSQNGQESKSAYQALPMRKSFPRQTDKRRGRVEARKTSSACFPPRRPIGERDAESAAEPQKLACPKRTSAEILKMRSIFCDFFSLSNDQSINPNFNVHDPPSHSPSLFLFAPDSVKLIVKNGKGQG